MQLFSILKIQIASITHHSYLRYMRGETRSRVRLHRRRISNCLTQDQLFLKNWKTFTNKILMASRDSHQSKVHLKFRVSKEITTWLSSLKHIIRQWGYRYLRTQLINSNSLTLTNRAFPPPLKRGHKRSSSYRMSCRCKKLCNINISPQIAQLNPRIFCWWVGRSNQLGPPVLLKISLW
jgi:hypothetical protein